MARILIVGGSDAGISAGLRIRELDPTQEVAILVRDAYPNDSLRGLPFLIGGQVDDPALLAPRGLDELHAAGLEILPCHHAVAVDAASRLLEAIGPDGQSRGLRWDRLLLATGARPLRPSLPGIVRLRVFPLRSMRDGLRLQSFLELRQPRRGVIVDGGYVGLEMAEALSARGMEVTLLEKNNSLLTPSIPQPGRPGGAGSPLARGAHPHRGHRHHDRGDGRIAAGAGRCGPGPSLPRQSRHPGGEGVRSGDRPHLPVRETGPCGRAPSPHRCPHCPAHKDSLPSSGTLHFRFTGDCRDGRLLGAQLLGPFPQELSKRLDVLAPGTERG